MSNRIKRSDIIKRFLVIQLSIACLMALLFIFVFNLQLKNNLSAIESSEKYNVKIQGREIGGVFKSIVSDILYLSEQNELHEFLKDPSHKEDVARDWIEFSNKRGVYDQIRFINSSGIETIRVNFNDGKSSIVPDEKLHREGDTYYFKETFRLDRGDFFISLLDFNIEYGKIELPQKAMIRVGSPVIDNNGTKRGIVILNYLGERIIYNLRQNFSHFQGHMMLLNPEGYWLMGIMPKKDCNFTYKNNTFKKDFPGAWERISTKKDGQFYDERGLFTFQTVFGVSGERARSASPKAAFDLSGRQAGNEFLSWKLISYMPKDTLAAVNIHFQRNLSFLYIFLFVVIAFVSWPLSQISLKRKRAEEDLKTAYGQLERKVEERTQDLLHANWELEREVVDRKRAEEVKESLIRHKDMFINQLGHDLKTPLTVLVTLLPLIEK